MQAPPDFVSQVETNRHALTRAVGGQARLTRCAAQERTLRSTNQASKQAWAGTQC
jgi:hypothetical protein